MSSSELNSLVYKYLKSQGFEEAAANLKSKAPSVCRVWSIVWNLVNNVWHWFSLQVDAETVDDASLSDIFENYKKR